MTPAFARRPPSAWRSCPRRSRPPRPPPPAGGCSPSTTGWGWSRATSCRSGSAPRRRSSPSSRCPLSRSWRPTRATSSSSRRSKAAAVATPVQLLGAPTPVAGRQSTIVALPVAVGATCALRHRRRSRSVSRRSGSWPPAASRLTTSSPRTPTRPRPTCSPSRPLWLARIRPAPCSHSAPRSSTSRHWTPVSGATGCGSASRTSRPGWSATRRSPPSSTPRTRSGSASAAGVQPGTVLEFFDR